jgi:hypothetical protein
LGRFVRDANTFSINPDIIVRHVQRMLCNK